MKQYSTLFFILRGQPFHLGHQTIIDRALEQAALVVIGLGSANRSRDLRNPWFPEERMVPIMNHYEAEYKEGRLIFVFLDDFLYNNHLWEQNVQTEIATAIRRHAGQSHLDEGIALIGLEKDRTSFYLKKFPQWDNVPVRQEHDIDATSIRKGYFGPGILEDDWVYAGLDTAMLPKETFEWLMEWRNRDEYHRLVLEHQFNLQHQLPYRHLPHGHIDQAVDAVVVQSGHVLMAKRGQMPGKGLWALPGGYLEEWELMDDAGIRELTEEVGISFTEKPKKDITERILRGSMVTSRRFGDPHRSQRGRIITEAFLFDLEPRERLPWIYPQKPETLETEWFPLAEVKPRQCFEDHYFIIQEMIRAKR